MMELNKKVLVLNVAVLLFLMGFSATVEAGRYLDPAFIISQVLNNGDAAAAGDHLIPKASAKECCDKCVCDVKGHPEVWCTCKDEAESCRSSCPDGACICKNSVCRCWEYTAEKCPVAVCSS